MYDEDVGLSGVLLKQLNEHQLLPIWEIKHVSLRKKCIFGLFFMIYQTETTFTLLKDLER